jgi:Ca2+-binding EF-hand superfamily protein
MRVRLVVPLALLLVLALAGLALSQHPALLEEKFFKEISKPPKPPGDEMEKAFKDFKKFVEGEDKLPPDPGDKFAKDIQKAYEKAAKLRPGEEEKFYKDIQKAFEKAMKLPPSEEEQQAKEMKKAFDETLRAGGDPYAAGWADTVFAFLDRNGDGRLDANEMSPALREGLPFWDTNRDGRIDRAEYRRFFQARTEGALRERAERPNPEAIPAPSLPDEETKRPAVYRAGKLPADLPAWFAQLDADGDGQVSLYEWRIAGKPLEEFPKLDRDDDGFLTVAEVLYAMHGRHYLNGVAVNLPADDHSPSADTASAGGRPTVGRAGQDGPPGDRGLADGNGPPAKKAKGPKPDKK